MKIAIVILNWNGVAQLQKYLPVVFENTDVNDCQIIVADNGSTDESVRFVNDNFPACKIIQLDQNYGFAGGYNLALRQVDADVFCLLNSDVRVTAGWLDPIVACFSSDEKIAAIQPKILSDRDHNRFEHAGAAGGFVDKFGYPFCRGRIMDAIETDLGQYNQSTDIFWASGACLFIRSKYFIEAGGFDSDYFAHMEEIDLCWRLKNQGFRIVYCPKSKVFHWGGATLEYENPRKLYLNFRNSLWTLYKNYTGSSLSMIMISRMLIDTIAIAKYALTFHFTSMRAIVRAHVDYHKSKKQIAEKRNQLLQKVKVKKHNEMLNQSIVGAFFLLSKRKFSSLTRFVR